MSCDCCPEDVREPRSHDYYDGLEDAIRYAGVALESAYGYKSEDIPRPVVAVLGSFSDLLDEMESRRMARFRRDVYAKVLSGKEIETLKFVGEKEG